LGVAKRDRGSELGQVYAMSEQQQGKLIDCKCGHKIAIPPGYEDRSLRCPNCLAILNKPGSKPEEAKRDAFKPISKIHERQKVNWRVVLKRTVLWAVGCGVGFGLVAAAIGGIFGPMLTNAPERLGPAAVWGFLGLLLGVLWGATWGIANEADLGPVQSHMAGALVGGVLAAVDCMFESFVEMTDSGALECFIVGIFGGLVAAVIVTVIRTYRE